MAMWAGDGEWQGLATAIVHHSFQSSTI